MRSGQTDQIEEFFKILPDLTHVNEHNVTTSVVHTNRR